MGPIHPVWGHVQPLPRCALFAFQGQQAALAAHSLCTLAVAIGREQFPMKRVNRAHWPTKENKQNLGNFGIFPAYAKNGPGGPQMGPGGFSSG